MNVTNNTQENARQATTFLTVGAVTAGGALFAWLPADYVSVDFTGLLFMPFLALVLYLVGFAATRNMYFALLVGGIVLVFLFGQFVASSEIEVNIASQLMLYPAIPLIGVFLYVVYTQYKIVAAHGLKTSKNYYVFLAIATCVAGVVSMGLAILTAGVILAVRACELSGSSKCL